MLTEFLKSIRGEKALWETIITGVDVCNFRLQGNTKDPFIPISLQPLHFEVFFCFAGHVVLKQQWNRVVVVRKQEILLLSEVSSLYSVACTADLAGILVSVDATTAKESLYSLCRMMGDLKLNTFEVKKYMDKQDGCAVIHGSSWVFSTFSEIVKMEDFQKSRYCVWKSVELLFLLSTGTLYPKDKDNLKIAMMQKKYMKQVGHADVQMFFYVDSAVNLAGKIGGGLMDMTEEPYYRYIPKNGLKLSTKVSMAVSDRFCMVKMICLNL